MFLQLSQSKCSALCSVAMAPMHSHITCPEGIRGELRKQGTGGVRQIAYLFFVIILFTLVVVLLNDHTYPPKKLFLNSRNPSIQNK